MKITFDWEKETGYSAVYKEIAKKYPDIVGWRGSFVVQLKVNSGNYTDDITTLLIDNREYAGAPEMYDWEKDWWEGERDIELVGVAPVSDIDLSTYWSFDEKEEEN